MSFLTPVLCFNMKKCIFEWCSKIRSEVHSLRMDMKVMVIVDTVEINLQYFFQLSLFHSFVFGLLCMYRLEYRCKSYVRPVRVESKAVSVWTCDIQCDGPIYSKVIRLDGETSCLTEERVY